MSQSFGDSQVNKKRGREEDQPVFNGSACLTGQAPKFARQSEGNADVKYGTGKETNEHRIETRIKQIQFGKNTIGYDNYLAAVPKKTRSKQQAVHPRTPNPYEESSKRQFDGRIKAWRRELHKWDVMDNIAQVAVTTAAKGPAPLGVKEVESGEVTAHSPTFGTWANKTELTVLAPVVALAANKSKNTQKVDEKSTNVTVFGTELDYPSVKSRNNDIGENIEDIEGINYDCEAPSDGDEDVL